MRRFLTSKRARFNQFWTLPDVYILTEELVELTPKLRRLSVSLDADRLIGAAINVRDLPFELHVRGASLSRTRDHVQ